MCRSVAADAGGETRMVFVYKLELADGTPADPPTFTKTSRIDV
jgi:hypothetical protein